MRSIVTGTNIYHKDYVRLMKSQISVTLGVAIVAAVLVTGLTSTIYAQSNMTGGNMTGGNMTGATSADGGDGDDGDNGNGNGDGGDDGDGSDGENGSN